MNARQPPTEEEMVDAVAFDFVRVVGTMVQSGNVSGRIAALALRKAYCRCAAIAGLKWEDEGTELSAAFERESAHVAAIAARLGEKPEEAAKPAERRLILVPGSDD